MSFATISHGRNTRRASAIVALALASSTAVAQQSSALDRVST